MDFALKSSGAARGEPRLGARWLSTNLTEADIISGGGAKLKEAIIAADRRLRPSSIFVLNTCAPAIIGDDIDEEIKQARAEVSAPVYAVHCSGFKSKVISTAYDAVYHAILKAEDFTPIKPVKPSQGPPKVNLFNAWSMGAADEAEIKRLLRAIGIDARVFVEFKSPDQWRALGEGDLNVSLCHVHDLYFLEFLRETNGQPYVTPDIPVSLASTKAFILDIAKFFNLEKTASLVLEAEEKKVKAALTPWEKELKGKRAIIIGGYLRTGGTALLLSELGLKIASISNYNYDAFGNELFTAIEKKMGPVSISVSSQPAELLNQIKRLKPDVAIAHSGQGAWMVKAGIPSLPLFAQRFPYFGYAGAYSVATRLRRLLANPNFAKNLAKHVSLPFTAGWYAKDPFHYLINSEAETSAPEETKTSKAKGLRLVKSKPDSTSQAPAKKASPAAKTKPAAKKASPAAPKPEKKK
jgi:nitrogenase molybdenum-iron protein alpha chain